MTGRTAAQHPYFHEAPLVGFTAAAVTGAGLTAAWPLAWALSAGTYLPGRMMAACIFALLLGGLAVSVLHLGRPLRAAFALRRAGRSALATEVLFASLSAGAACLLLFSPERGAVALLLWTLASLASLALLASVSWVYWLPGQITWKGLPALSALPLGLLTGLVAHTMAAPLCSGVSSLAAVAITAIDAVIWAGRCLRVERGRTAGTPAHPWVMTRRRLVYGLRFLLVTLPASAAALRWSGPIVLVTLGLGILVDRFAFYGLAVMQTTEHELVRIESIIRELGPQPPGRRDIEAPCS